MIKIQNRKILKIVQRLDQISPNALIIWGLIVISIVTVLILIATYMASSKLVSIDYQVFGKVQGRPLYAGRCMAVLTGLYYKFITGIKL